MINECNELAGKCGRSEKDNWRAGYSDPRQQACGYCYRFTIDVSRYETALLKAGAKKMVFADNAVKGRVSVDSDVNAEEQHFWPWINLCLDFFHKLLANDKTASLRS